MPTIEFNDQEWEELLDNLSLRSDDSYSSRVAEMIADKVSNPQE